MPTYSYRCTECGTAFDIQQAFTDDSLTVCPQVVNGVVCGGKLRKLFNTVGVTFNGSGFYRTDSRSSEKSGKSETSVTSRSDSAPAAASTAAPASAPTSSPTSSE